MVKSSVEGSSSVPSFLMKCYEMVDDHSTDGIISWSDSDDSFVIWDMTAFSLQLLPNYFKHNNFSSFMRQLNIYGFRKTDTDRWEFSNEGFIRGQKQLMTNIIRRKNLQNLNQRKSSQENDNSDGACSEIENFGLWKEVESLKTDKNSLMQELVKLRQLQETSESKLLVLRERLQGMETDQQQMLSFLIMAMLNPGFLAQLLQPKENNWRTAEAGNNMLEEVLEGGETLASDGMLIEYHPSTEEAQKPLPLPSPTSNSERSTEFDIFDGMKDLYINLDFMKIFMDEKLSSAENHDSFIRPDLPDDSVLQQLLRSSHFLENTVGASLDSEEPTESMEMESTVGATQMGKSVSCELQTGVEECQNLDTESTKGGAQLEIPQNLDLLTKKMALLASQKQPTT